MRKVIVLTLFLFLLAEAVLGATIRGIVYDSSLKPAKNVIIEVNSSPTQRFLARDGTYLFSLPAADYKISASYETTGGQAYGEELISVIDDGRYVLDIFLVSIGGELDFRKEYTYIYYSIIVILIIVIAILVYFFKIRKKKELESDEIKDIITLLKKNNGRMTQKEIRKYFDLSEAKISLMISDLEEQEKLKRVKKGRGNIIILK